MYSDTWSPISDAVSAVMKSLGGGALLEEASQFLLSGFMFADVCDVAASWSCSHVIVFQSGWVLAPGAESHNKTPP